MALKKLYKAFTMKAESLEEGMLVLSPEQLEQLHKVLLIIVDDIKSVCDEENITWILGGGSALGAVRHQGFIPWDDDFDINMPRESFDRFIVAFKKKFRDKYYIHTPIDTPEYGDLLGKIRLKGTVLQTDLAPKDEAELCVFIDIFPIENVPDNPIIRTLHGVLCNTLKICAACRKVREKRIMQKKAGTAKPLSTTMRIRMIIGTICSFLTVAQWTKLTAKAFSLCKNSSTKLVTIPPGRWHYFGSFHERAGFCNSKLVLFEGRYLPICEKIEDYMQILYGSSYMQIPPENKRETHGCWKFDVDSVLND